MKKAKVTQIHDLATFHVIAQEAIESLPKELKDQVAKIVVRIENFPTQDTLEELNLQNRYDLLGLYKGIPLPSKQRNSAKIPDVIYLYRAPLIVHAREHNEPIEKLVYHVMIHEIGHHFGFSDQDINWIKHYQENHGESC